MISQESKKKNWFRWSVDQDPLCMSPIFRNTFLEDENGRCYMDVLIKERLLVGKNFGFDNFSNFVDVMIHDHGFSFADMEHSFWKKMLVPNWRENRDQFICETLPHAFIPGLGKNIALPVFSAETITGPNGEQRKVFFPENERDRLADFTKEYFSE